MASSRVALKTGLAGLVGCLSGISIERYRRRSAVFAASAADYKPSDVANFKSLLPSSSSPDEHLAPNRTAEIMLHGCPSADTIRSYRSFVLAYDRKNRTALWVLEHLSPAKLENDSSVSRDDCEFFEDSSIHPYFRSQNSDYFKSGYDRGHLAPAGDSKTSKEDLKQTFVLSNISPQVGKGFNRGMWNRLEQYVRYRARRSLNTWVCTGPLYLPSLDSAGKKYIRYEVIGKSQVAVPTHFFKVLLVETSSKEVELECYVMQNKALDENIPLQAFQVPLDSIERAAGFLIFDRFPKENLKSVNGLNAYLEKFNKGLKKPSPAV